MKQDHLLPFFFFSFLTFVDLRAYMTLVEIKLEKLQEIYGGTEGLKKVSWPRNLIFSTYLYQLYPNIILVGYVKTEQLT